MTIDARTNTRMTTSTHDPEPKLDAALRQIARVEAPAEMRARVGAAIAPREPVAAGRVRRVPARLAAAAALAVACVAAWWLSGTAPLPAEPVAGLDAMTGPPSLRAAAVPWLTPAAATEAVPDGERMPSAPPSLALPIAPVDAQVAEHSHSLPPLPEPPEPVFENVGPAPLLLARLEEPAPIVIEPLTFPTAPPDQDGDTGDSPW